MSDRARFWSLISIAIDRQYGGNPGYKDDDRAVYRYDSKVPNHLQLSVGDVIFIRDRHAVQGVATIETIGSHSGVKELRRCPSCRKSNIKVRKSMRPEWRCYACKNEFETPITEDIPVTKFEAYYGSTYRAVKGQLSAAAMKAAAIRPSDQISIEQLDPTKINLYGVENTEEINQLIALGIHKNYEVGAHNEPGIVSPEGKDETVDYIPDTSARRARVLRAINERRGQTNFRKNLIRRYDGQCVVSGCEVASVLEAAHIWPYVSEEDNHPANGLLLRSDLHTLFDLDLLGIEPGTFVVKLHPDLRAGEYGSLDGNVLCFSGKRIPSNKALYLRWLVYLARSKKTLTN